MLYRICSVVRREDTSPKGEGSMRRYFCGEAAAAEKEAAVAAVADDGEAAAEVSADNGAHRRRFGDAGLSSGSKSRVLFRVAPHAMAGGGRGAGLGRGRGEGATGGKGGERGLEGSLTDGFRSREASGGAPVGKRGRRRRRLRGRGSGLGGGGRSGRAREGPRRQQTPAASGGALPPPQARLPGEKAPAAPAVRQSFAPHRLPSKVETSPARCETGARVLMPELARKLESGGRCRGIARCR